MSATLTARTDAMSITVSKDGVSIRSPLWPAFSPDGLRPTIRVGEREIAAQCESAGKNAVRWTFPDTPIELTFDLFRRDNAIGFEASLTNRGSDNVELQSLMLLAGKRPSQKTSWFGPLDRVRVYEQDNYSGNVRWGDDTTDVRGQPVEAMGDVRSRSRSQYLWMAYGVDAGAAFLAGAVSADRWIAGFDHTIGSGHETWRMEIEIGKLAMEPGATIPAGNLVFMFGRDPWSLLESYGDLTAERREIPLLDRSPVTFCSWYPHRLGVSERRILDNARVARDRLKPLGLNVIQLDLGWERGHLPAGLEESDLFPNGLKGLADRLAELGLELGAWCAPYCILENDPLAAEHPELLIKESDGRLKEFGTWFWQPHGRIFLLDLLLADSQEHLRRTIQSLADRGVRYLKADFIGMVGHERGRIGARITRDALTDGDTQRATYLSCAGPDIPGPGSPHIIYACVDTGNTGFVSWRDLRPIFTSVACHLFKHRRWGIIQPSCLSVGLPGTIGEARARATMAFLSGGEISIGDDLTLLPEDRWRILLSTLPTFGVSARVIDLFDPLPDETLDYSGSTSSSSLKSQAADGRPSQSARVWDLSVATDWDAWRVVGVFDYGLLEDGQSRAYGSGRITMIDLPLARLNLPADGDYWVHEFWSGQSVFAPVQPAPRETDYEHPGDRQALVHRRQPDALSVGFFGPDVKLLVIRKSRAHPWPLATSFHQSGGTELSDVRWDKKENVLFGALRRPKGESGSIFVTCPGWTCHRVRLDGCDATFRSQTDGMVVFDVICGSDKTTWEAAFEKNKEK